MELMKCKKCGKILPKDYKGNKCEACQIKVVDKIKPLVKVAPMAIVAVAGKVVWKVIKK